MKLAVTITLVLGAFACGVPEEGPWMEPGADCQSCHAANGQARDIPWTISGTVFEGKDGSGAGVADAKIIVTDANGTSYELPTNGAGNFYTAETLKAPWHVAVERAGKRLVMPGELTNGACNSCHTTSGDAAVGALHTP